MRFFKRKNAVLTAAAAAVMTLGLSMSALAAESMGAVYSSFQNGIGWSSNSGDNTYAQASPGSYGTAMKATLSNQPAGMTGTIIYQVNLSGSGWLTWEENFSQNGTTTTTMPLEAVRIQLTGQLAENYDVYYSVYENGAWTDLVMNGQTAGTEGRGLRVDGLRIAITAKGAGAPAEPKPVEVHAADSGFSGSQRRRGNLFHGGEPYRELYRYGETDGSHRQ